MSVQQFIKQLILENIDNAEPTIICNNNNEFEKHYPLTIEGISALMLHECYIAVKIPKQGE